MLDDKQKILNSNSYLNKIKNERMKNDYDKAKRRNFIISIFLSLIIIATIYLVSNKSNIYRISVKGNIYYNDGDIVALSGLTTSNKYIFVSERNIERKIKKDPLIAECVVIKDDDYVISIEVKEKKIIGYTFEDKNNVLVLEDDSRIEINNDNLYLIENAPLLEGLSKEDIILIEKQLVDVDYTIINEISEIHYYPKEKYQNIELIMRDGNYIFTSAYGLNILNSYYAIKSSYDTKKNTCYYFEDISGRPYTSACPWVRQEEIKTDNKDNNEE